MDHELYGILTEIRDITIETKTKVETICEENRNRDKRISDLEKKPARKWETFISAGIAAIVGAIVAFFTKKM